MLRERINVREIAASFLALINNVQQITTRYITLLSRNVVKLYTILISSTDTDSFTGLIHQKMQFTQRTCRNKLSILIH